MTFALSVLKWIGLFILFVIGLVALSVLIVPGLFLLIVFGGILKFAGALGGSDQGTISSRNT